MEELMKETNKSGSISDPNPEYIKLKSKLRSIHDPEERKRGYLKKVKSTIRTRERIHYVRYAEY
jgi:hypothetical protein